MVKRYHFVIGVRHLARTIKVYKNLGSAYKAAIMSLNDPATKNNELIRIFEVFNGIKKMVYSKRKK